MSASSERPTLPFRAAAFSLALFFLANCFRIPQYSGYTGPEPRPPEVDAYYRVSPMYYSFDRATIKERDEYLVHEIRIHTPAGSTLIDFYQTREPNDDLILVFDILGGKPIISRYFADYFARNGFDAAIVHRNNEFKRPENLDRLENLFRESVIRDRAAMDFFEKEYGKKDFGSFGVSRGAINVAMTAGSDSRLKYNVMVMGGSDLPQIFDHASERGIEKFINGVTEQRKITRADLIKYLEDNLKTDPKYLAQYIDARDSMLVLAVCDNTVPFKNGLLLREQIGRPDTVFVVAGHRTGILYTQFAKLVLPFRQVCFFPLPYIETEALSFFRDSFGTGSTPLSIIPMRILQFPANMIARGYEWFSDWFLGYDRKKFLYPQPELGKPEEPRFNENSPTPS